MTISAGIPTYDQIVQNIQFDEVVKQIQDLPSLPAVVMELLNSIEDEDIDISVLAQKVSLDQALTAKTLRFANSSFYGTPSKVTTIQQAITLLGVESVRNLITAAAMTGCFPRGQFTWFDFKGFWRHSIATALCANILAKHLRSNQDYAFTAGLLHDIGRLVLVTRFPQFYEKTLAYRVEHDCYPIEAERKVMGVDHVMAGHVLASHWNFSEALQNAIVGHHEPEKMENNSLAAIVHIADGITHALDLSAMEDDLVPPLSAATWKRLGIDEKICMQVLRETEAQFEGINRLLA